MTTPLPEKEIMSDASEIRQKPSAAQFIANGDTMLALHHVDRLDARIDTATVSQVIDALRYWIGETHALREESNASDHRAADKGTK
jgi:hypothetical protein